MGKPLFKASDGDQIDILMEWEVFTQSELYQGSGTKVLHVTAVRPEAFPNGSPMSVLDNLCNVEGSSL